MNPELYTIHATTGEILFIGDLEAGKRIAEQNASIHTGTFAAPPDSINAVVYYVHLCENQDCTDSDEYGMCGNVSEWGHSKNSMDEAWQYALASLFGPLDEDYDETHLIALLELAS